MMGETMENVAQLYLLLHATTGVCAGITPFNFPAMIPLWMFPLAIVCGNTILKPSERDPPTPMRLAELFVDGCTKRCMLFITKPQVDRLLEDPVRAISFVGSVVVKTFIQKAQQTLNACKLV